MQGWNGWVVYLRRQNGAGSAVVFENRRDAEDKAKSLVKINAGEVEVFEVG